ncbi:uncharacterized protein CcaverHIS019_0703530 [Cutaneotrichosporon cavernicola]|uniref:Uncharacterized protein n=1 Tax=Cutaneotrichosporon cavernicola TaxID=279322 RepID=A0AA48QYP7_9TREE|nr:uncharacterized protein CcaverHIS019_0703530 [Cutaneotrichosporon cavernicola]BEI94772.1 hypothetical protein CcaverHIS019_0703530 [Cutaneotrichosporon cavernicola]
MDRRTSVAEGSLSSINWASVAPPLMPPSAKTAENPLRRLSLAQSELPPPRAPTPEPVQDRHRRESLAALYPPTPSGVIALARDAASNHSSYWTNIYLILILPPVLFFALSHRVALGVSAAAKSTWHLLTDDPNHPAYKKAGALQIAAHLLMVPLFIAVLYFNQGYWPIEYCASALLGIMVIALLPMRPLAAVIVMTSSRRAKLKAHVGEHVEIYILSTTVIVVAVGLYALLGHINAGVYEEMPSGLQNQLAEQVVALRAELAALKAGKE